MSQDAVSLWGVLLIVVNWLFAVAILLEYVAVQELLGAQDANWQDAFDSGTMACASIPVTLGLVPAVVAAGAALAALALRRVRTAAVGWASLAAHLALLVGVLMGPAAPGSAMGYWARLALFAAGAVSGIVAGANLRPFGRPRASTSPVGPTFAL